MAVAAMTIIGCQEKEIETYEPIPNEGSTFELFADIVQTKTTLNGYDVEWDADDVLYMATSGEDTPWSAVPFTYSEGMFTNSSDPKATLGDGNYSVNAIYCAYDQATYHKNTGTTHKLQPIQNQKGKTTIHIQDNDALAGSFDVTIPTDEPASVEMIHLYTLMQVNVKNSTGADIEITKFEMTAAGANLAGIFTVSFATPAVEYKSGGSATISVNISEGTVSNGDSFPVYFVMAPLTNYSGDVTFKVTDAVGKTYTKTVPLSGISFEAGKYNTTPYTIKDADVVTPNVTWDLTTNSYTSASSDMVTWTSDYVNLSLEKGESSSDANAYLGGTNEHTRVYKDHVMTFAPVGKYQIENIEFAVLSGYTDAFETAEWTNGNASTSENTVTVTPVDGHKKVSAVLGAATRFSAIKVYYSYDEDYELPTVASIAVEGQKTELVQGAEFDFGGTVTATYTNDETADVTSKAQFTGYDMSTPGEQTVTVSYTEEEKTVTTTYALTVLSADADITDVLNLALTGASGGTYSTWADKTSSSSAVYAGNSAGSNNSIQLRTTNSNSGVVTTKSGGYATKVVVEWNAATADGRTLQVYAKNTSYTAATDLYDNAKKGTLIGTIVNGTSTELEINADYQYIGFRSADGAMYLSEVKITWSPEGSGVTPKSERELAFSSSSVTATLGDDFTEPTLNGVKTEDVTYTSSNTTVATVDPSTGAVELLAAGTTTITASAPETDEYNAGSAKYTLTVKGPQAEGEGIIVTLDVIGSTGNKTADGSSISWTSDGFTVTNEKTTNSNAIRNSDTDHYRAYKNSILKFTASNKTFDKVVITCTGSSYASALKTSATNAGYTTEISGSVVTVSTTATSEISVTASDQIRIKQVEVVLN